MIGSWSGDRFVGISPTTGYRTPQLTYLVSVLTLFGTLFLCLSHSNLRFDFCPVPNLPHLRQFVHSFALQWLPIPILLGTSAHQTFGLCQLFPNLQTWLVTIWLPLSLQQQLLKLSFVLMIRRNLTFGSASNTQICQCPRRLAQASPSGHFGYPQCLQRLCRAVQLFETNFAWAIW